jgi:hypothetical protein
VQEVHQPERAKADANLSDPVKTYEQQEQAGSLPEVDPMRIIPIHLPQPILLAIKNMVPDTYPVQPQDPSKPLLTQVQVPIPKQQWDSDWIVSVEDDIKWLSDKFMADVGDYMWVREAHRLHLTPEAVVCEYADLEKRQVPVRSDEVRWPGRKLAPLCMFKRAARYVLKIHAIDTMWADDKKTNLVWRVDVSRCGNVYELTGDESK